MQSFLQYRRFKETAKAQLERDRAKAESAGRAEPNGEPGPCVASPSRDHSKDDLEKGDSSMTSPDERVQGGVEATDMLPHGQQEEEVEQTAQYDDEEDAEDGDYDMLAAKRNLSRISTQQSYGTALGTVLSGVEVRKRTTREGGHGNVFVVNYESADDPNDPHNWSYTRRFACTFLLSGIGCVVGFASAIDSSVLIPAAQEFGVGQVTESLATGLFLIGFGVGGLVAGPISETIGRNPVYIGTLLLYMIFIMASGLAPNIGAQLAFRFIAGIFGSTPLTCAGGSISDLWNPMERVFAFPIFANAAFTGPLLGPVVGGWISQSTVISWRWTEWVTLIFSGIILGLVVLFQPETYPPLLLKWKAKHLREITGDQRYKAEIEIREVSFFQRITTALYRPFLLTFREPIIILIALYLTVIYIILFGFLDGFEYIFHMTYGVSEGITGLCFLGIIIGLFGASALVPLIYKWARRDMEKIREAGGDRLPPEFRLWYSMLGGAVAIPVSLFWMGWTARPSISIWSPLAASVLFGYGVLCVFITSYQYVIDSYEVYAASALASVTFIRYIAAGAMVVVSIPMYENLGVHWSLTLLGCLSALLVPVPYIFYRYGPWIRSKSKYAINADPPKEKKEKEQES